MAGRPDPETTGSGDGGNRLRPAHAEGNEESGQSRRRWLGIIQRSIVGIPEVRLAPVINALAYRLDADDTATNTSARTYNSTVTMLEQSSYNLFRYLYNHQVECAGLQIRPRRIAARVSARRPAFPALRVCHAGISIVTQLGALQPELKDWVSLTHPLVPDYIGGGRGVTNIPCEIIGRSPDYRTAKCDSRCLICAGPAPRHPTKSFRLHPWCSHRYSQATVDRAGDVLLYYAFDEWSLRGSAFNDLLSDSIGSSVHPPINWADEPMTIDEADGGFQNVPNAYEFDSRIL